MKILMADDSSTMRRILRNILEKLNFKDIVEAEDGEKAVQMYSESQADIILLDWNMPNLDGLSALKKIRLLDPDKKTKILMCTSESEKGKIIEAIKSGANSYIVKPFTPEIVAEKLKELNLIA